MARADLPSMNLIVLKERFGIRQLPLVTIHRRSKETAGPPNLVDRRPPNPPRTIPNLQRRRRLPLQRTLRAPRSRQPNQPQRQPNKPLNHPQRPLRNSNLKPRILQPNNNRLPPRRHRPRRPQQRPNSLRDLIIRASGRALCQTPTIAKSSIDVWTTARVV